MHAQLQGASLSGAHLQGAHPDNAQLPGASLNGAQLQGASLAGAQLQGALLSGAQLQGAWLMHAQLQGAWLVRAQLQGAWLREAQLQGASLEGARLQGASLDDAQLQGATLAKVLVWRADARKAVWEDTRVASAETGPNQWSVESFEKLKKIITEQVPEGNMRRNAIGRIEQRLDPGKAVEGEDEMADAWEDQADYSPRVEVYEERLAGILRETGCAAYGAPYVFRGLFVRLESKTSPFDAQSPQPHELAKAFLDEEHCPGAHGLSDAEKAKLKAIRDRPPPPAPKQ